MIAGLTGLRAGWPKAACLSALSLLPQAAIGQVPDDIAALRGRALELVNESRQAEGLDPLTSGDEAVEAAQAHADDMFARGYYAHESPEGETVGDRYLEAGGSRWHLSAENIARCVGCLPPATAATVEELHQGWMDSPGHRANILSPGLATFGFGLTIGAEKGIYAVQTFAGPGVPPGLEPDEEPVPLSAEEQAARALAAVNRVRDRAGQPALALAPALGQAATQLLPPPQQAEFTLAGGDDLFGALPEDARAGWAGLGVVAGACGGCGVQPVAADIRRFVRGWQDDPGYRASLTDPQFTHMGFALQTDGQGRKIAVLVLGGQR